MSDFNKNGFKVTITSKGEDKNRRYAEQLNFPVQFDSETDGVRFQAMGRELTYYKQTDKSGKLELIIDVDSDTFYDVILNEWIFGLNPDSIAPEGKQLEDFELDKTKPFRIVLKLKENIFESIEESQSEQNIAQSTASILKTGEGDKTLFDSASYLYLSVLQEHNHVETEGSFWLGFNSIYSEE